MTNEQPEPLRLAEMLDDSSLTVHHKAAAMLRKLYVHNTELENSLIKKSIAIQKIWKERDELRQRQVADEALLRQALDVLENHTAIKHPQQIYYRDSASAAIKERLK